MASTLERLLRELGFSRVELVASGNAAVTLAHRTRFDVILLDRLIQGEDGGIGALRRIRAAGACRTVPVLMISSLGNTRHRTEGLIEGASDYVPKPVELDELGARINAQIWMSANNHAIDGPLKVGPLEVSLSPESLQFDGKRIKIPTMPLRVIYELARSPGQTISFSMLWDRVWYMSPTGYDKANIERTVRKARGFLEAHEDRFWGPDNPMITSTFAIGYMIAIPIQSTES